MAIGTLFVGYMDSLLNSRLEDMTFLMTFSIFAVFVHGLIACTANKWCTSAELNNLKTGVPAPNTRTGKYLSELEYHDDENSPIKSQMVCLKFLNRIAIVPHTANSKLFLDLIGTGYQLLCSAFWDRSTIGQQCKSCWHDGRQADPRHLHRTLH
jgi:hypothetical protein